MAKTTKGKTVKTNMAVSANVTENNVDEELALIEQELLADGDTEGAEKVANTENPEHIEEVVSELAMDEAKDEAYAEQDAETEPTDMSTAPIEKGGKGKKKKASRKTMTGSKKSEVAASKLGENADGFALVVADAKLSAAKRKTDRETFLASIDSMAVKVGEKAINLVAYLSSGATLSTYTDIALRFLIESGEMTAKSLIEHYQDQKANGVKGYSIGTARSQAHQMMQLLPQFKVGTLDGKTLKLNSDSLIVIKHKA